MKYLQLVFVLTYFAITILPSLTSETFIDFLQHKIFLLLFESLQISTLLNYEENFGIIFQLIDTRIFLKIYCGSSDVYLYLELIQ